MRIAAPTSKLPQSDEVPSWLSILLHTTDSTYPIGGFAHSGGLEGMVALGHVEDADDLGQFLHNEIADTLANVELPLLRHAWLAAEAEEEVLLALLDQMSEATRFSAEQRQASRRLGAQRWSLLENVHASKLSEGQREWLAKLDAILPHKHLCVVAGIEACLLGVPIHAAMVALSHQTVVMVAQAAMKIMRIGQTQVQALVAEMACCYPALVTHALTLDVDDIGVCMPLSDTATAWHESAPARMFLS